MKSKGGKDFLLRGIDPDLHKQIKLRSVEEGISMQELILDAVKAYLKKGGKK